jgi:hypothetical protein
MRIVGRNSRIINEDRKSESNLFPLNLQSECTGMRLTMKIK